MADDSNDGYELETLWPALRIRTLAGSDCIPDSGPSWM